MKLPADQVLDVAEAVRRLRLLVGPGGALGSELGQEIGLLRLRIPLGRLESLRLLGELGDQPVPLLGQLAALCLLAAQSGVGFAQLLLQGSVGLWEKGKKKEHQSRRQGGM